MNAADPTRHLACALGRVPSGLFVLTARSGQEESGMLASWVQQCSFDPPRVSVALHPDRHMSAWLTEGAAFTVNVLDSGQTDMVVHFGKGFPAGAPAFEGLDVSRDGCAAPVLSEALAYLDCRVATRCRAGDHDLVIADVFAGRVLSEGRPMVHVRKSGFHY